MTNITSMDALEAIPIDHIVRVDGVDWARTVKGLMRDGVDLGLFHFEGRVNAGTVVDVDNMPVAAGEWWGGSTRSYYIHLVDDRYVYYSSFRSNGTVFNWSGDSRRNTWDTSTTLHRLTEAPPMLVASGLAAAAVAYGNVRHDYRVAEQARAEAVQQVAELRGQVARRDRKPDLVRQYVANIRHHLDAIAELLEE